MKDYYRIVEYALPCGKGGVSKTAFIAMLTKCLAGKKDTGRLDKPILFSES